MGSKCKGCGSPKKDTRKHCKACRDKLTKMRESGYLPHVGGTRPKRQDSRGHVEEFIPEPAIHEDDYGDESGPDWD